MTESTLFLVISLDRWRYSSYNYTSSRWIRDGKITRLSGRGFHFHLFSLIRFKILDFSFLLSRENVLIRLGKIKYSKISHFLLFIVFYSIYDDNCSFTFDFVIMKNENVNTQAPHSPGHIIVVLVKNQKYLCAFLSRTKFWKKFWKELINPKLESTKKSSP